MRPAPEPTVRQATAHPVLMRRATAFVLCLLITGINAAAFADRHCSFARESAFYARELSSEAEAAPLAVCPAKMTEALDRLGSAMIELEICSCSFAEEPLRRWRRNRPPDGTERDAACRESAASVNRIARTVLTEIERCF